MAITQVSSAAANATTLTMPSHQAGDVLVMAAYRDGNNTPPTIPAGWTQLSSVGANTNSMAVAYKIAASGSETSGTWTNATQLACVVYRSANQLQVTRVVANGGTTATVNYAAIAGNTVNARYLGFAGYRTNNTDVQVAPTGMTAIVSTAGASTGELAAHDTGNTLQDGWSSTNYVVTGTSSSYRSLVVEIRDSGVVMASASTNVRGSTSLNVAYSHATSGKAAAIRYMARTADPIDELYVFLDDSIGTIGSITMEAKIYNEGSVAARPGSTLRDTSTATVVPGSNDKWVKFTFGSPYTPAVGEILWLLVYNTSGTPGTDAPAILTSTNMTISGPDAGYTTADGFTTDGTAAEIPFVVKQGSNYVGQPFTQQATTAWASNTWQRGLVITPTVDVDISGILFDPNSKFADFKLYADATAPGGTALLTVDLDSDTNITTADLSGARIFATPYTLVANTTYKAVLTYGSSDDTYPLVYEIEDYSSYSAVFDALRETDPFFNPWLAIDDNAGGWTIKKDYAAVNFSLLIDSLEITPPASTTVIVVEEE